MKIKLEDLKDWHINNETNSLEKEFLFKSYLKNISFVNAVAYLANKHNHHPEIIINYNRCLIRLTTHDVGNLITEKDIQLAYKIDDLLSDV